MIFFTSNCEQDWTLSKPEWVLEINTENMNFTSLKNYIEKYKNFIVSNEESAKYISSSIIEEKRLAYFKENLISNEKK